MSGSPPSTFKVTPVRKVLVRGKQYGLGDDVDSANPSQSSNTRFIVAVTFCSLATRVRAPIVSAGLHPVAADGHRAPPRRVGLAPVDQEQPAFGVRALAQPPWT
jgi:hypothetical protein